MSELWPVKQLADICEIFSDGNWIESKDQSPSGIRLVQTGNIGEGVFKDRKDKARYISESTFSHLNCSEIFEGDCLISRLPRPVGRACLIPNTGERMITAVDCSILRFKQDMILPQYFVYYSQSAHYNNQIQPLCTGSTRKRISRKNLGKIKISIPPLEEQQRIVSILDKAFENIAKSFQQISTKLLNSQQILESTRNDYFFKPKDNWEKGLLGEFFETSTGNTPSKKNVENYGDFMPLVKPPELMGGTINTAKDGLSEAGAKLARVLLPDSILVSCIGNLGKIGLNEVPIAFNQQINAIHPDDSKALPRFMLHQTLSIFFRNQLELASTGTTIFMVNKSKFNKMEIILPPISEQKTIVSHLDALSDRVSELESIIEDQLESLQELKQSILQEAFNGKLTGGNTA